MQAKTYPKQKNLETKNTSTVSYTPPNFRTNKQTWLTLSKIFFFLNTTRKRRWFTKKKNIVPGTIKIQIFLTSKTNSKRVIARQIHFDLNGKTVHKQSTNLQTTQLYNCVWGNQRSVKASNKQVNSFNPSTKKKHRHADNIYRYIIYYRNR